MMNLKIALTLYPEWAWAVCHLGKDIDNRDWKRNSLIGQWLCIHAGQNIGGRRGDVALLEGIHNLMGIAQRNGQQVQVFSDLLPRIATGAIVAVCQVGGFVLGEASGWHVGLPSFGWRLENVTVLPRPVPCKGAQGLWTVPDDVLLKVSEQIRPATPKRVDLTASAA